MKQFLSFVRKEFYHIFRDKRTMLILLAMPIVQIVLFGFAISTEVKNSRVAVLDPSKDVATRAIVQQMEVSEYFTINYNVQTSAQVDELFRRGEIDLAVVFGQNFARNMGTTPATASLQLIADGADPNTAMMVVSYATAIISSNMQVPVVIDTKTNLLYNPGMKSAYNFVPGVMGMILMLICAMMTSIAIVREKERGTMEVLLVSPLHPILIILSKAIPYLAISIINLCTILLLSFFVLDVPLQGSLWWLGLFSAFFIFVSLCLGLLISTLVRTQVAAMLISGMVLMMPTVLLSGMMFPIENMPWPLQAFSSILPARWYIAGVRKLMIQGVDVVFVTKEFIVLAVMAAVLLVVSLKKFKIRL